MGEASLLINVLDHHCTSVHICVCAHACRKKALCWMSLDMRS